MKAMAYLIVFMTLMFTWTAFEAAERVEANWKAHEARLEAARNTH